LPILGMSAYIAATVRGHSRPGMAGTAMLVRRNVLMGVLIGIALTAIGARAAEPSAKSFVEAIYAAYKGKNGNGIPLDTDAAVKRYFEPKLAALIIKDRKDADKRGEVGTARGRSLRRCAGLGDRRRRCRGARYRRRQGERDCLVHERGQADDRGPRPGQAQGGVADRRHHLGPRAFRPQGNLARTFHRQVRCS
jgi:hypothetical protein